MTGLNYPLELLNPAARIEGRLGQRVGMNAP